MALFQSVAAFTVLCLMIASAWDPLNCPTPGAPFEPSCASVALPADAAVTLFFQSTESTGYFDCSSASVTYCTRNWTQPLSSTVGSCYFLLVGTGSTSHTIILHAFTYSHDAACG